MFAVRKGQTFPLRSRGQVRKRPGRFRSSAEGSHFLLYEIISCLMTGIGYVGLSAGFQETTAEELDKAIRELKQKGMESLVLDLRGNVGGLLPQAIEVTSRFIRKGKTVVSVKGRSNYSNAQELKSVGGAIHDFPLVVMINGGSASASEIVAGANQDYGRGMVVGSESFGKGLVPKDISASVWDRTDFDNREVLHAIWAFASA